MPPWITSDSFAREVSAVLAEEDTSIAAEDLQGAFHADSFRSILTLYVNWDDAAETGPIADAAVHVLQTLNQDYFPQFAAVPLQVIALDDVEVNESAPPITARIGPLLRIIIGLAAGVGLAVLAEYLDDTIHDRADVEALGLQVVAEIPAEH
jgi:capsular polysaccharide biosynthesis protein